ERIEVVFSPAPGSASPSPFPTSTPETPPANIVKEKETVSFFRSPTVGWVAVGVGGAMLVGSSVSIIVRQGALNDIETQCPSHQNCPRHLETSQSTARTFGALGLTLGILGGASVVTGVVILVQPRHEARPTATVGVAPWMTASGAGATGTVSW